ncbi:hypothetical protein [Halobacillus sp. B23F22_1]
MINTLKPFMNMKHRKTLHFHCDRNHDLTYCAVFTKEVMIVSRET